MKNFKQILSLITEAKMEPGGEDLGKLFGPRGRFSPKKAEKKEPTARSRMKSGELTPNPDRPSGMEELLRIHPPEKGEKEPTALSRMKSGELDYRLMPSKPESKKPTSKKRKPTIEHDFENDVSATFPPSTSPLFKPHADRLKANLQALHDEHISSGQKLTEQDKGRMANQVANDHLRSLKQTISELDSLPSTKKHGQFRIKSIRIAPAFGMAKDLHIEFEPLKTHVDSSTDVESLSKHLEKKTGHLFYLGHGESNYMVGTHGNPLIMQTSIFHPDIKDEDEDGGDDNDDFPEPEPIVPKSPRGKKPQTT
jgi:hypothetical protein